MRRRRETLPIIFCAVVIGLGLVCLLSQLNLVGGQLLYYPLKYKTQSLMEEAKQEIGIAKALLAGRERVKKVEDAVRNVEGLLAKRLYKQAYNGALLIREKAKKLREETIIQTNREIKRLRTALWKERRQRRLLCKKIYNLKEKVAFLQKKCVALRRECASLKEKVKMQQELVERLAAEKEKLSKEVLAWKKRYEGVLSALKAAEAENERLKEEIARKEQRVDVVLALLREKGKELKEANSLNQSLKERLRKASEQIMQLRAQLSEKKVKKEQPKTTEQLLKETHLLLEESKKIGAARYEPERLKELQAILKKITQLLREGRENAAFALAQKARQMSESLYLSTAKRVKGFEETVLTRCIRALVFWKHED